MNPISSLEDALTSLDHRATFGTTAETSTQGQIMKKIGMCAAVLTGLIMASSASTAEESGLAASHDLAKEGGRLCMSNHGHSGSGTGASKQSARASAIRSWIEFTGFEYGRAWASFAAAAGSSTRYTKEASGWSATVEGRPCRR